MIYFTWLGFWGFGVIGVLGLFMLATENKKVVVEKIWESLKKSKFCVSAPRNSKFFHFWFWQDFQKCQISPVVLENRKFSKFAHLTTPVKKLIPLRAAFCGVRDPESVEFHFWKILAWIFYPSISFHFLPFSNPQNKNKFNFDQN